MTEPNPTNPADNAALSPDANAARARNRRYLLLIGLITVISLAGSYSLFFSARDGGVWGTTNQGEFVQPAVQATDLGWVASGGEAIDLESSWWVWLVDPQRCAAECEAVLTKMRAMHVLLHKDAKRLRRAYVQPAGATDNPQLAEDFPELRRWQSSAVVVNPQTLAPLKPGIYIVDPLGNLVFYYPVEQMGKPVLTDLKRLLKVSQIG